MKGVQICATTGVLENAIGYYIAHVKSASVMMVTADSDLAKLRMETAITPMLQESGLLSLIKSNDEANTRKTGKTDKKLDWLGGGFLIPNGAQNPNKFRSLPIRVMLRDEIDGWPDVVGKDGDPLKLTEDRTATYETERKILDISTPLIKGQSKIATQFEAGDQRYYHVNCLNCAHPQRLRFQPKVSDAGVIGGGLVWDKDANGLMVTGTVRYLCEHCGHPHTNDDKTRLLAPENGAQWVATVPPSSPDHRSYHCSALYSPVGMQSWDALVRKWDEAWDSKNNRPRDHEKLQVFYNNVLGEPFELRGDKLKFEIVSSHRRHSYKKGEIPNKWASEFAGGPILVVVCTVDVHGDNLAVAVWGWCRDSRLFLIDYERFRGDTEQTSNPDTWGRLKTLIETKEYRADDGKRYRLELTLVDSGYRADQAYEFAASCGVGVFPVKGRGQSTNGVTHKEFSEFETSIGTIAYWVTVDIYKDRWSARLKRQWDGRSQQPDGFFNAPVDITTDEMKELTAEVKREKIEQGTGKRIGVEWHRPGGAPNELWDTLVYASAGIEMIAREICINQWQLEFVNWPAFWDACLEQKLFFSEPPK
jgi:phage terminase large subunit GpA-like protein